MNAIAIINKSLPAAGSATEDEQQRQYLTFMLGGEMFAIGILNIKEIIRYAQLTEVPRMPDFIRGVINLRGVIVPIVDLRLKLNIDKVEYNEFTVVII